MASKHHKILAFLLLSNITSLSTLAQTSFFKCSELFIDYPKQLLIQDLNTLAEAMTKGMLLHKHQSDLFEVYRKTFFGDPGTSVDNKNLNSVTEILGKYPELKKLSFREYKIIHTVKNYQTPDSLNQFLKSQIAIAGQVRSNLFQIEANLGFWKKLLGYNETFESKSFERTQQNIFPANKNNFLGQKKNRFIIYLNRIINKTNRALLANLKNDEFDYPKKLKSLFFTIKYLKNWMQTKGRDTKMIRQAMVDLVNTVGFANPSTLLLLKSKNPLDKIEGFKKTLEERETTAFELGFTKGFIELQESLSIEFPKGYSKNEYPIQIIQSLEKQVLLAPQIETETETFRIRALSIQEAPFRSCLGGDCSTRKYFEKALDPNFIYFTMTDSKNRSSGHATLVLGEAYNSKTQQKEKVAFLDKLQNIPLQKLPSFLQAISLALKEHGYQLGIPEKIGDTVGLSNSESIRNFIAKTILPKFNKLLTTFMPLENQYKFPNAFSRAYDGLDLRIFEVLELADGVQIRTGEIYQAHYAHKDLDKNTLTQELLNLRNSNNPNDIKKYITSSALIIQLEQSNLYLLADFLKDLNHFARRTDLPFNLRKLAILELIVLENQRSIRSFDVDLRFLLDSEQKQIAAEIRQWNKSNDIRKKKYFENLTREWFIAARDGKIPLIKNLIQIEFVDPNLKNNLGETALIVATKNYQMGLIEFLLTNDQINIFDIDNRGLSILDHALALGNNNLVNRIKYQNSEIKWNQNENILKNYFRTMNFISVDTNSLQNESKATIESPAKPFELMSTLVTQNVYLKIIGHNPSKFKIGDHSIVVKHNNNMFCLQPEHPVESINYEDSLDFIEKLNLLSVNADPLIYELIPDHKIGYKYDLITEQQFETALKLTQTEDGEKIENLIEKNERTQLSQYVNFNDITPVGIKKPLFINGKPVYDLLGKNWIWFKEQHNSNIADGTQQNRARTSEMRPLGGGILGQGEDHLRVETNYTNLENRYNFVSLRLVRLLND